MFPALAKLLPSALRVTNNAQAAVSVRGFMAVADVEINLGDRETLKKYVGVRDFLSKDAGTKGKFMLALREVLEAVKVLPAQSDYRNAVEATVGYRLKVCEANDSDTAIEEVLDAHLEELIHECKEEIRLIPLIARKHTCDKCHECHAQHMERHGFGPELQRHMIFIPCQTSTLMHALHGLNRVTGFMWQGVHLHVFTNFLVVTACREQALGRA